MREGLNRITTNTRTILVATRLIDTRMIAGIAIENQMTDDTNVIAVENTITAKDDMTEVQIEIDVDELISHTILNKLI